MKLPFRTLKIAGQSIKVKLDPKLDLWGQWDRDAKVITLGACVISKPSELIPTLVHEMRHAALDLSGVSHGMSDELQEQVVRCLDEIADPAVDQMKKRYANYINTTG